MSSMPPQCGRKRQGRGCAVCAAARGRLCGAVRASLWRRARRWACWGIGLPDIPLFLGGLLRGLYRIALSYGFDCHSDRERRDPLLLVAASLSKGEERERFAASAEAVVRPCGALPSLEECMDAAAGRLAEEVAHGKVRAGAAAGRPGGRFAECSGLPARHGLCCTGAYERRWLLEQENREK